MSTQLTCLKGHRLDARQRPADAANELVAKMGTFVASRARQRDHVALTSSIVACTPKPSRAPFKRDHMRACVIIDPDVFRIEGNSWRRHVVLAIPAEVLIRLTRKDKAA